MEAWTTWTIMQFPCRTAGPLVTKCTEKNCMRMWWWHQAMDGGMQVTIRYWRPSDGGLWPGVLYVT